MINTVAESLLGAINFFVKKTFKGIKQAPRVLFYLGETGNSFHKEYFSLFVSLKREKSANHF